jgi:hypothetical protein
MYSRIDLRRIILSDIPMDGVCRIDHLSGNQFHFGIKVFHGDIRKHEDVEGVEAGDWTLEERV